MQFGYDNNRLRIRPTFSGQKAICPLCGGTIIGKCGEIYAWHWQHHKDRECDPWQEHETEWHQKWKANFPDDWQEVIIKSNEEKHIADVKTAGGLVLEFQNSSISSTTIKIREAFYQNMIWVVNARTFKDNFKIRSVVSSRLRSIEEDASNELLLLQDAFKKDLKIVTEDIEKNKTETADILNRIKDNQEEAEKLNQQVQDKNNFTNAVIEKWSRGESYWDYKTKDITTKIESEFKNQLHKISMDVMTVQDDVQVSQQGLIDVLNLENFEIADKQFKIVQYQQIPLASFLRARAISKASRSTFFPEIIEFKTESELRNFQYRQEQFDFIVDPSNAINTYTHKIEEGKKAIELLEKSLASLSKVIRDQLVQELKNRIGEIESEIKKLDVEWDELIAKKNQLVEQQAKIFATRDENLNESKAEIETQRNNQRFKVMSEKKGLYTFDWKHERKSWKVASSPIFFDIGESYLFEKIKDGVFKKTEIRDFLQMYLKAKTNTPSPEK